MKSALSARLAESALTVVDDLVLEAAKTREMRGLMVALGLGRSALIVVAERNEDMTRATRNLPEVRTVTPGSLNLLDVLKFRHLVLTRPAVEALTEQLLKEIGRGRPVASADGADGEGLIEELAPETGASVAMDEVALANAEAGEPRDVAVADAAEAVASTSAAEADAGSTAPTASASTSEAGSADEDEKGDA